MHPFSPPILLPTAGATGYDCVVFVSATSANSNQSCGESSDDACSSISLALTTAKADIDGGNCSNVLVSVLPGIYSGPMNNNLSFGGYNVSLMYASISPVSYRC